MATATLTLTEFLLARITEDEDVAKAAKLQGVTDQEPVLWEFGPSAEYGGDIKMLPTGWWPLTPARVLAECAAKRQVLDLHDEPHDCLPWGRAPMEPCSTLVALAAAYADHPDCREEWR